MEAAQLRLGFGAFVGTIHPSGQSSGLIAQLPVLGSTTTVKRFQRSSIWARIRVTNRRRSRVPSRRVGREGSGLSGTPLYRANWRRHRAS